MHTQKYEYPGYGELYSYAKWFNNQDLNFWLTMYSPEEWRAYCYLDTVAVISELMENPIDAIADLAKRVSETKGIM